MRPYGIETKATCRPMNDLSLRITCRSVSSMKPVLAALGVVHGVELLAFQQAALHLLELVRAVAWLLRVGFQAAHS